MGQLLDSRELLVASNPTTAQKMLNAAQDGSVVLTVKPSPEVLQGLDVAFLADIHGRWVGRYAGAPASSFRRLEGFGPAHTYASDTSEPVVVSQSGQSLWVWRAIGKGGVLIIGSDLVADIVRFRQGDPSRRPSGNELAKWGYAGERADYLYAADSEGRDKRDRPADWPLAAIAHLVRTRTGKKTSPALPNGAHCAIILTGDTDGATAEHYSQQRCLLRDLPITYFLRTACAAGYATLQELERDNRTDLQLHPDALDSPDQYALKLADQTEWFRRQIGRRPSSVRNHGYLNDGYWRHAEHWIGQGQTWSANLPGVDGLVLNGSLLPARLMLGGKLTPHWSISTPYGDGMVFALGMTAQAAADQIQHHVESVPQSGVPGLVTINLHPANVAHTAPLHDVLHKLAAQGVLVWSMADCARWFEQLDTPAT